MSTGTIHIDHRNRLHPRIKGHSRSRNIVQSKAAPATPTDAPIRLAPSEVRETAKNLRELVLWDLREEGYTFREIGELLGMTKQRASQIERKMIRRAAARALKKTPQRRPAPRHQVECNVPTVWIRAITTDEFESRLDAINRVYQAQFDRIIERRYKRQRFLDRRSGSSEITEFWKVWPLIEAYQNQPFSFSKLVADFPELAKEPHLPQLLCRLRRTALLRKVGMVKVEGHNHPEVLMAEAPVEQHVTAAIERLIERWSNKLRLLRSVHRPTRPSRSIEVTRQCLIERLVGEGVPRSEIEEILRTPESEALAPSLV